MSEIAQGQLVMRNEDRIGGETRHACVVWVRVCLWEAMFVGQFFGGHKRQCSHVHIAHTSHPTRASSSSRGVAVYAGYDRTAGIV